MSLNPRSLDVLDEVEDFLPCSSLGLVPSRSTVGFAFSSPPRSVSLCCLTLQFLLTVYVHSFYNVLYTW